MMNLKQTMQDVLEQNILSYWIDHVTDKENGGYYGRIDGEDKVHPQAEKGAVMNARILWAFLLPIAYFASQHISKLQQEQKNIC